MPHFEGFEVFSCSIICRLQLYCVSVTKCAIIRCGAYVLSAWEKSVRLWHLVADLAIRTYLPSDCRDTEDDCSHDRSIGLPIVGLRVPSS